MFDFPAHTDRIPLNYPIYAKGDWHGVLANVVGRAAELGRNLRTATFAIVWVTGCVLSGVVCIAAPQIWPWFVFGPVLALFAYPAALRLGLDTLAHNWWDNFHAQIGGAAYPASRYGATLPVSSKHHEGVHLWQRGRYGWGHVLAYGLDPRGLDFPILRNHTPVYRAHAEAQAYGFEVAKGWRTTEQAAVSMAKPIYALGLTKAEAVDLVSLYAARWLKVPGFGD